MRNSLPSGELREACISLLLSFPYLAQHMDPFLFLASPVSYAIFSAIRDLGSFSCQKMPREAIYGEIRHIENCTFDDIVCGMLDKDLIALALLQTPGCPESYKDVVWEKNYLELKERFEYEISRQ